MSARSFGVLVAVVMVAALVIAMPPASAATTLFVDGSAGCDDTGGIPFYCTIQAAIDDAIDGDTISIAAGTYTGSGNTVAVIDNKDLTVVGAGQGLTLISGSDTGEG
jgi:pectin methylesterase-like acyl-CoA thioesterase